MLLLQLATPLHPPRLTLGLRFAAGFDLTLEKASFLLKLPSTSFSVPSLAAGMAVIRLFPPGDRMRESAPAAMAIAFLS